MNTQITEKIESFVKRSAIPQLNIGIWHQDRFYQESFGKYPSAADVFETGSIGKTFTATLLAVLVENDVVGLHDRVSKFFPDFPFAKDITLLQLATHSSGLPGDPFKGVILNAEKALHSFNEADYTAFLKNIKKPLKPGDVKYSNLGMALLGNILADHLGLSYEQAVINHVLEPLGLTDTHVSTTAYESSRLAIGHSGKGLAVPHFQWESMEPAGVWRSTTKDMMTFLKAHLGCSGDTWKSLLHQTTLPPLEGTKRAHQGLAWQIANNKRLGSVSWHNGQTLGQKSVAAISKANDSAVIILSNKVPKLWQHFFSRYSIELLAFQILESLTESKQPPIESDKV